MHGKRYDMGCLRYVFIIALLTNYSSFFNDLSADDRDSRVRSEKESRRLSDEGRKATRTRLDRAPHEDVDDDDHDKKKNEKDKKNKPKKAPPKKEVGKSNGVVSLPNLKSAFATPEQLQLGIMLGKALFWDQQIGSGNGGNYACASCHYSAGADAQADRVLAGTFQSPSSPNITRGSLGVRYANFIALRMESLGSEEVSSGREVFTEEGDYAITDRNAPPSVDSDSIHNFWDGRANYIFNGVDITGIPVPLSTKSAGKTIVQIAEASQASQAVGPCLSPAEMSADGRTFADIGYKMCHSIPLRYQSGDVAEELNELGLRTSDGYLRLIQAAFSDGPLDILISDGTSGVTTTVQNPQGEIEERLVSITEENFAAFFGVAVGLYEQTLVSVPRKSATKKQVKAFEEMRCNKCHYVDGRSHAVIGDVGQRPFSATGVAPLRVDAGVEEADQNLESLAPNFDADPDEGQFKSTHLFNLTLTAPYFHDGSAETLEEMMDFYVRGGDFNKRNVDSHVRELDVSAGEYKQVLKLMKQLTDPRIEAGLPPFSHPSLSIPLGDGREVVLSASDEGLGGLHYTVQTSN